MDDDDELELLKAIVACLSGDAKAQAEGLTTAAEAIDDHSARIKILEERAVIAGQRDVDLAELEKKVAELEKQVAVNSLR